MKWKLRSRSLRWQKIIENRSLRWQNQNFVQIQSQLPFIGRKFVQEEARNAKPIALNWDDEPSKCRNQGNSPSLGIAREFPKSLRIKGFKMALKTKGSLVRI